MIKICQVCGDIVFLFPLPSTHIENCHMVSRPVLVLTLTPTKISIFVIHLRNKYMTFNVGRKGFEPSAFRLSVERSAKLSYRPINRINMTIFIRVDMIATDKNAFKSCSKLSNLLIGTSDKKCRYCHKNQK